MGFLQKERGNAQLIAAFLKESTPRNGEWPIKLYMDIETLGVEYLQFALTFSH